jgi:ubiquinone/menaquinone biosynthesis C-methylase UbiE
MIPWLVRVSRKYLNIDLHKPAMQQMDLTAVQLPDQSQTLIWCSHVLEHITDDRKALAEMFRVLEPGGLAVVQVPIRDGRTLENPFITTEQDRLREFLQEDHVRLYGLDLQDRIAEAGFKCEILKASDLPRSYRFLYGLTTELYGEIFLCRRPA